MTYLFIYLSPLLNFFLFEAFFFKASFVYPALALSNILILAAVRIITGKKFFSNDYWNFCIFPIIFSDSLAAYSLLIVNPLIVHSLFIVNLFFIFIYLKNIFRGEQTEFLENISAYGNLLTVFFLFAVIYGLESFLGLPIWPLVLGAAAAAMLVIYQIFWANKIRTENNTALIVLSGLFISELVWAIYFLPFNFNVLGLLAAICYYLLIGFIKLSAADKLTSRNIKLYLVSGLVFLILIILTAKWV